MSATYPQYPSTQFPDAGVGTMNRFSGVTASTKQYVDQYYSYYNLGDFQNANKVITDHPELKDMIISETKLNELRDNILAVQQLFLDDIEAWIFNISNYKGSWSSTSAYKKFDVISYLVNGATQFYQAISSVVPKGTLPTDINNWICITLRGEQGASGAGLSPRGSYISGATYYQYDMVLFDYKLWYAKKNNPIGSPNSSNSDWEIFFEFNADVLGYDNRTSGLSATTMQEAIDEVTIKFKNIDADTLDGKHASAFTLKTELPTSLPANGGNADTVDGKHASDFSLKDLVFKNKVVNVADWVADTTYSAQGYTLRAPIACAGATSAMSPIIVFAVTQMFDENIAPILNSYDGGAYIYAKTKPTSAFTISEVRFMT